MRIWWLEVPIECMHTNAMQRMSDDICDLCTVLRIPIPARCLVPRARGHAARYLYAGALWGLVTYLGRKPEEETGSQRERCGNGSRRRCTFEGMIPMGSS